jgi:hypothetical protein
MKHKVETIANVVKGYTQTILAILKTLAGKCGYGSFEIFAKIKVHFIHVYGNYVYN